MAPALDGVIPQPMEKQAREGALLFDASPQLTVGGYGLACGPLSRLMGRTVLKTGSSAARPSMSAGSPGRAAKAGRALDNLLKEVRDPRIKAQAYAIEIDRGGLYATAGGDAGLFYAAVTMAKMAGPEGSLPCCSILDRPALAGRAVLIDVSRGRVPKLAALMNLVDLLSELKFNQLTFNIEDTFAAPAHPAIGAGRDPLIPEDMKELAAFARHRCLEIIPFQQSLGHMRGIVSLPEYNALAYEGELLWSVDPADEDTYKLLADLYDAQIKATDSGMFHAGCDEPFDIMKRFDPERFGGRTFPEVMRDHLVRLHGMLADRGKTMMAWADAVVEHEEILQEMPDDLVLCHWLYGSGNLEGPEHYRPGLEKIAKRGLPFYACTCSWSMMKIFPDLEVMRKNHDAFIPEAKRLGADGAMLTIWGDMGHMNLAGLELYPLSYAARHFWEDDPAGSIDFDRALARTVLNDRDRAADRLPMLADAVNRVVQGPAGMAGAGFLLMFAEPFDAAFAVVEDVMAAAVQLRESIKHGRRILARMEEANVSRRGMWLDVHLAFLQAELVARKLEVVAAVRSLDDEGGDMPLKLSRLAEMCEDNAGIVSGVLSLLESRWLSENRESDLEMNRERYREVVRAWNKRARQMKKLSRDASKGRAVPPPQQIVSANPSGYSFNMLEEMGLAGLL